TKQTPDNRPKKSQETIPLDYPGYRIRVLPCEHVREPDATTPTDTRPLVGLIAVAQRARASLDAFMVTAVNQLSYHSMGRHARTQKRRAAASPFGARHESGRAPDAPVPRRCRACRPDRRR